MHREVVDRRRLARRAPFTGALNFCMLLPGPGGAAARDLPRLENARRARRSRRRPRLHPAVDRCCCSRCRRVRLLRPAALARGRAVRSQGGRDRTGGAGARCASVAARCAVACTWRSRSARSSRSNSSACRFRSCCSWPRCGWGRPRAWRDGARRPAVAPAAARAARRIRCASRRSASRSGSLPLLWLAPTLGCDRSGRRSTCFSPRPRS